MIMNDMASVLIPIPTNNINGRITTNYHPDTPNRIIKGNFQPLKYNISYKPYGISDTTSNVLYCKDFNLTADMHLLIDGSQYKIDSIQPWKGKHTEVYLTKVV